MNLEVNLHEFESTSMRFDSLMHFRVKHILLVSSLYDSYVLEEDGQLTDLIYNEYLELNLTITPHVKRASNAEEAMTIIKNQDIDLVLIFKRVSDIDVIEFSHEIKKIKPGMAVALLAYDEKDLTDISEQGAKDILDGSFTWTGDVRILLAIIKNIEDMRNVDLDTELVGVRVIILVEDSTKFYSSYLPLLYTEIMTQTHALMADGINLTDRLLRMRARPKILLASNYEEAWALYQKHKEYLLAVISDFRFPREGVFDDHAGISLIEQIRQENPDLPIVMQSTDSKNRTNAEKVSAGFLYKLSRSLHADMRSFIVKSCGFGDFQFLLPDGTRLTKVGDFKAMEKELLEIDEKSLMYHAHRNHFSNWLMARTEFDMAARLKKVKATEFQDAKQLRIYLIDTFKSFRREKQMGVVSDFSRRRFDLQSDFVRIGGGSLGGKGRGLAFVNALLKKYNIYDKFEGVNISVPATIILGTDIFDDFVRDNALLEVAIGDYPDDEIVNRFKAGNFPESIRNDLIAILEIIKYPLAVRSSSLLEDSHKQPYAGIYDTHMILNNDENTELRLQLLEDAIKTVYASTYFKAAKAYHESTGGRVEEEKMAVILQQLIGRQYDKYFYPSFSGVGLSYNYYPINEVKPEEGVAYVALGLGKTIVEGLNCLRFTPEHPEILPQFATTKDMLKNSQREFYAIDMESIDKTSLPGGDENLSLLSIVEAEKHGSLPPICSTYSPANDRVSDGYHPDGSRVITFAPLLKTNLMPLADILSFVLQFGSQGLNCPIEIEFAVELSTDKKKPHNFYFLQIRPMIKEAQFEIVDLNTVRSSKILIKSERALGNLAGLNINDIIFVRPEDFDRGQTVSMATQIGTISEALRNEKKPFMLIGPGRWGSSERWLGIPVQWRQISGAAVIVEAAYGDFCPDPSFGTHFLQNIISFHIGYLTVNQNENRGSIDFDWLSNHPVKTKTEHISHIELSKPVLVYVDGRTSGAIVTY